jgi:hypothetical protein
MNGSGRLNGSKVQQTHYKTDMDDELICHEQRKFERKCHYVVTPVSRVSLCQHFFDFFLKARHGAANCKLQAASLTS